MENLCFSTILFVLLAATAWQICSSQTQLSTTELDDGTDAPEAPTQAPATQAPGTQAPATNVVTEASGATGGGNTTQSAKDDQKDTASVISTVVLPLLICYITISHFAFGTIFQ